MSRSDPTLLIFAKTPVAGKVKTRLLSHASAATAAAIAEDMIKFTVKAAVSSWPGSIQILAAPDVNHSVFKNIHRRYNIKTAQQCAGDLGTKMENALLQTLETSPAAAIVGCDIPTLSSSLLSCAYDHIQAGKNVLGPSSDGGFYFVALNHARNGMFANISWGSNSVLKLTLERLHAKQIKIDVMLSCLQDIDTWDDFLWLTKIYPQFEQYLN